MEHVTTWCVFEMPQWSSAGEALHVVQEIVQERAAVYKSIQLQLQNVLSLLSYYIIMYVTFVFTLSDKNVNQYLFIFLIFCISATAKLQNHWLVSKLLFNFIIH